MSFQYVRSDTDWAEDAFNAHNFERVCNAVEFCRIHHLRQAYIICGEFDAGSHRFNAATKSILDIARLRSRPEL